MRRHVHTAATNRLQIKTSLANRRVQKDGHLLADRHAMKDCVTRRDHIRQEQRADLPVSQHKLIVIYSRACPR